MEGAGFEGAEPAGASCDIVEVGGAVGVRLGPFAAYCGAKAGEKEVVNNFRGEWGLGRDLEGEMDAWGGGAGVFLLTQMRYPSSASSGLTSQYRRIGSSSDAKI